MRAATGKGTPAKVGLFRKKQMAMGSDLLIALKIHSRDVS